MNIKEKFKQIKDIVLGETEVQTVEFTDAKLEDGTLVSYDKLEVDGKVEVINEDGTKTPLADGTYKLEDGTEITIVAGTITDVKPFVAEAAKEGGNPEGTEKPEDKTAELEAKIAEQEAKIAELEAKNAELEAKVAETETKMSTVQTEADAKVTELETKLAEIGSQSAGRKPAEKFKEEVKQLTRAEQMAQVIALGKKQK